MSTYHQERVGRADPPPPDNAAVLKLVARIQALLRRPADSRETVLRVGPLELDLIERTAKRGDRAIALLPREFRLPSYMMRHEGQWCHAPRS